MARLVFLPVCCILVLLRPSLSFSQITSITRFPHQDSTRAAEAFPVALSASTVLVVWSDSTAVRCAISTDGGERWNAPVLIATPAVSANDLSGIRTLSGRIMALWRDNAELKFSYSDDNGVTWSVPATLAVTGVRAAYLSQTPDGKLWLGISRVIGTSIFFWSTDNGSTWSQPRTLPAPRKYDITFVAGSGASVHCFYSLNPPTPRVPSAIERITTTDGGATWSFPVTIVGPSQMAYRPRVVRHDTGTLLMLYEYTRVGPPPLLNQQTDIVYVTSTDNGVSWSTPNSFTRFIGDDILHNVTLLNDQPFVTFASGRWITEAWPATQIWYGILGQTPDTRVPPVLLSGSPFYPYAGVDNWINATVDDETGIASVSATYWVNGVPQPPVQLFDDGMHLDGAPHDGVWGNAIAPLPAGAIEFRFTISDLDSHTLYNRFGTAFTSTPPPHASFVSQGTSMKVSFDNSAVFGIYAMDLYPGFGINYPVPSLIEHLYGAGIWIGGKIDTTSAGTGERIKAVSTGYEGWVAPLRELFPPNPASDTVWRVYGRNAPKPPGWDQYWGTSLPYRAPGDENFFCFYNDYSSVVAGHVPMGVKVIQSSFTWNDATGHAIQILDFRIMNNSPRDIDSAYIGFFADADVGPVVYPRYWERNSSGYFADVKTAYTFNPVDYGSTPVGLTLLNTHRVLDSLRLTFQWYPGTEGPTSDNARYDLMSLGVIKPDEYPNISDSRIVVAYGPFTIRSFNAPNPDTLNVAFAFISGTDLNQMRDAAIRARTLYSTYILDVKDEQAGIPREFALEQNYPNPFNPTTVIRFRIPVEAQVTLDVTDVLGRKVATLISEKLTPGTYEKVFDGANLSSGVYIYRLKSGEFSSVKKALLLK